MKKSNLVISLHYIIIGPNINDMHTCQNSLLGKTYIALWQIWVSLKIDNALSHQSSISIIRLSIKESLNNSSDETD